MTALPKIQLHPPTWNVPIFFVLESMNQRHEEDGVTKFNIPTWEEKIPNRPRIFLEHLSGCGKTRCINQVQWIGFWNGQPIKFTRSEVTGNGDCLFDSSSIPGVRVVKRASLVNWLTQQHNAFLEAPTRNLPDALRLLTQEMFDIVKDYVSPQSQLQRDLREEKPEALWFVRLRNDRELWADLQEAMKTLDELVRFCFCSSRRHTLRMTLITLI